LCGEIGACIGTEILSIDVFDEYFCKEQCRNTRGCRWYTYHTENNHCILMETCNDIDIGNCPKCSSSHMVCGSNGLTTAMTLLWCIEGQMINILFCTVFKEKHEIHD